METMGFKQIAYDLKELDESKGVVTAYANVYNFKDCHGDISAYGSFDKTVSENFKRIRVLKDHDPKMMIGVPLAIDTKDSYGLLPLFNFLRFLLKCLKKSMNAPCLVISHSIFNG